MQQQRTNSMASEVRQSAQLTKEGLSFSERSGSLSKSVTAVLDAIDRKRWVAALIMAAVSVMLAYNYGG